MEQECVSLLPRVCEVLLDTDTSLPDDTSLEKLLDWLTALTEAGSLLTVHPCLLQFISTAVSKPSLDPGVISFALKLCGLIAAVEDDFNTLQQHSVLDLAFNHQRWCESGLWEEPCVRVGWIQGLRSTMQHLKALRFFVQEDLISPLLHLQTDTSLFVASAANQLLAHVLLFFQPSPSAGRNGISNDISDWPVETSQDYTAVVTVISAYLKESLLPGEKTHLHQSEQVLRLLGVLLHRAMPPLQDQLLQTVAGALEEVAAAGDSRLTLPLMDAILSAHSSSTNGCVTSRLLSSMFNTNKLSDLVHVATAFLRRGRREGAHAARAVRTLLLPLHIITGQTLLDANAAEEERQFLFVEHLKRKTCCISVICVCLSNMPQIALMPPDSLPCSPPQIITAVLSLLRICCGDSTCTSTPTDVFRNVIGSGKVQKSALEALTGLSGGGSEVNEKLSEVLTLLIQYLNHPDSDATVLHKSYQALIKWLSVCEDFSSVTEKLRQDLVDVVKKRACDMRWEVRDSTVEFVGNLAAVEATRTKTSEVFLDAHCSVQLLKEALQDPESYVRASAVTALAHTLTHSWQQGAAHTQEQTDIVRRLLEILSQDTEGFARRAVVQYFIAWFSSSSSSSSSVLIDTMSSVLSLGAVDLDWEVKVHTLELAKLLLDDTFSGHRGYRTSSDTGGVALHPYAVVSGQTSVCQTLLEGEKSDMAATLSVLVERGVMSALFSGLVDCDRPVALKACQLLITLRDTLCPRSLDATAAVATASMATVTCELPGCGWGREIRKILGTEKHHKAQKRLSPEDDCATRTGGESVGVCEVLTSLGLDAMLDVLTRSSDHVQNSPLSLLQDILTVSNTHDRTDTQQPGREVIVDCY